MAAHVVANLYGEEAHRSHACGVPERPLKKPAQQALAVAGSLARVVAEPDDVLWLDAAIDPERLAFPRRFRPGTLEVGRPKAPRSDHDWYWMTPPIARSAAPWVRRDWAAKLAREWDPEFRIHVVRSEAEFRVAAREAKADSPLDRWIAKTNFSAAGRERWTSDAASPPPELLRAIEIEGSVIVEPWVERSADFGLCGTTDPEQPPLSPHEIVNDPKGRFRGIRLRADAAPISSLEEIEAHQLVKTFERVRAELRAAGYSGPFGIDAFRYRNRDGEATLRTLVEVNPRHSMGSLARLWVAALSDEVLEIGEEVELVISGKRSAPREAVMLVTPNAADRTAVWFERSAPWTTAR